MLSHLLELRRRIIYIFLCFGTLFLVLFFKADGLFQTVMGSLLVALPEQSTLIATQITSPLITPVKLAADCALLLTAPFALYHIWLFISPGLHQYEKKPLRGALFLSFLFFFAGLAFCFYVILPFMFQFFVRALPKGVVFMPDIVYALDFTTRMLLIFGFCFQIPLVIQILVRLKIANMMTLKKIRPYVIVGAFIIGMVLTPPDVLSQVLLAVPLCILYESGILLASYSAH